MYCAPTPQLSAGPVIPYADGRAGAFQTLRVMRGMVNAYRVDPYIRQCAANVVHFSGPKDETSEVNELFKFVRDQVRYLKDIHQVETLSTPDKTLLGRIGDCDDKATLFATLAESIGYPTRFVLAGYHGAEFEHVYLQVYVYDLQEWVDVDTTEDQPLGYAPPNPTTLFFENV